MKIEITTNDTFDPESTVIVVNGNKYKNTVGLQLKIAKDAHGSLVIEHESGYLEAYQAKEEKKDYE
jgi:hypothetical protein